MGTADYCIVIVFIFFGLMVWSIQKEEHRRAERRISPGLPPDGLERRAPSDRRGQSLNAYLQWALKSGWARLTKRS